MQMSCFFVKYSMCGNLWLLYPSIIDRALASDASKKTRNLQRQKEAYEKLKEEQLQQKLTFEKAIDDKLLSFQETVGVKKQTECESKRLF